MHKVLITKELSKEQEAIAHDYGLEVVQTPFIKVTLEYDTVQLPKADVWIVTSSNAARYLAVHFDSMQRDLHADKIIAIGESTANHLNHLGIPIEMPNYGTAENVVDLVKRLKPNSAVFFSGNLRSNVIPQGLQDELDFYEFQVYQTELLDVDLDMSQFSALAFFSPSGVKGFAQSNHVDGQKVVAVGTTTKQAVQDHLGVRARIAASPNVEDVLFALKEDLG